MKFSVQVAGGVLAFVQLAAAFVPPNVYENTAFAQSFDVSGSYVRKSISLSIKNIDSQPHNEYFYAVTDEDDSKTSIIEARVQSTEAIVKVEQSSEWVDEEQGLVYHKLTFPLDLEPGSNINLILAQAFVDAVEPLPAAAAQNEKQMLVFRTSKYPISPYLTRSATTRIKSRPGNNEEITKEDDGIFSSDNNLQVWGPYENVAALSFKPLAYRFEFPVPLPKITRLQREIWVSHWGASLSFEETYWLKNLGTSIKGEFSRLDFQKSLGGVSSLNSAAIRDVRLFLPPFARDVYYTDLVGNVSTSRIAQNEQLTELEVKPRYPVFGGWGYNFTIGWSNDADQYIKVVDKDQYLLKVPFLDGPADIPYGEVDIAVILPEGAEKVEVLPPGGTAVQNSQTYSYLDTVGRPTVKLSYNNLVDSHRRGFIYVSYTYSAKNSLRKPLTIAATFAAVIFAALILSKIDLRIDTESSPSNKASTPAAAAVKKTEKATKSEK